jgi:hypothetical protein
MNYVCPGCGLETNNRVIAKHHLTKNDFCPQNRSTKLTTQQQNNINEVLREIGEELTLDVCDKGCLCPGCGFSTNDNDVLRYHLSEVDICPHDREHEILLTPFQKENLNKVCSDLLDHTDLRYLNDTRFQVIWRLRLKNNKFGYKDMQTNRIVEELSEILDKTRIKILVG